MHPKLLGCSRPDQYVPCSRSENSTVLMLPCILKDARAIEQRDTWCQYPLHFFLNCLTLSKSPCVSHCHSLSVQPELKRILCSRLVWNITYLTCWWIDGCSQLPPSLLCRLHSGVSLSAQDTQKDFSTSGKFETAACVYIGNDSPSGLWEESYRSQWEHCILSADQ